MNSAVQPQNLHGADERTTSQATGTATRDRPAMSSALAIADDATVQAFAADGAVVLRRLLTPAEVAVLRAGIDANLAAPSPRALVASRPDDPGFFIEDFCNWADNPHYRQVIFDSALAPVAARLMQSRTARLYHDHMLTKEPGTRQPTPWHQDQPYYNVDGMQNVSFWIPADPVSRAATLEFAAGTHRGPWLMPRTFMTNEARWFPEGALAELPHIEAGRYAQPPTHRILGWALEPGDAVAFHMLTLHASGGVEPGRRRRVFSVRFLGDDMRHAPRPWRTSPEFPGLADELPAGAEMDHPLFPMLWDGRL
jgi:ectoine hydroxylase-related dioxygenase (phytanoyl-CoA dioxygenase family)